MKREWLYWRELTTKQVSSRRAFSCTVQRVCAAAANATFLNAPKAAAKA